MGRARGRRIGKPKGERERDEKNNSNDKNLFLNQRKHRSNEAICKSKQLRS